jgi:hypothetical protein
VTDLKRLVGRRISDVVEHDAHGPSLELVFDGGVSLHVGEEDSCTGPHYAYKGTRMFVAVVEGADWLPPEAAARHRVERAAAYLCCSSKPCRKHLEQAEEVAAILGVRVLTSGAGDGPMGGRSDKTPK